MSQVSDKDVAAIKDWMDKEPTLPKNFNDLMIKKFLFSCHCKLEPTKKCIQRFCTGRATTMSEVFTNRDPQSNAMKIAFETAIVTTYSAAEGVDEILIQRVINAERFNYYDCIRAFMLQADQWIRLEREVLPENHIVIIDIKEITLMVVAKSNVLFFQKLIIFLLEAMPVRLSQIHLVNCPSFYEYLYGLVKGVLSQEVRDMVHFHPGHMGLHKFIDKKYLPSEYDGDAESMLEQSQHWIKELIKDRKSYIEENLWKADLSKKEKKDKKNGSVEPKTLPGSFNNLTID